jgi:hypothetical protein
MNFDFHLGLQMIDHLCRKVILPFVPWWLLDSIILEAYYWLICSAVVVPEHFEGISRRVKTTPILS